MLELKGLQRLHIGPIDLVETGECVSVSGQSGSGKSKVLQCEDDGRDAWPSFITVETK